MKQRNRQDDRGGIRHLGLLSGEFGPQVPGDGAVSLPAEQRLDDGTMDGQDTLRMRRRARRVEDHRVVVAVECHLGHRPRSAGNERFPSAPTLSLAADGDEVDAEPFGVLADPLEPLPVDEQHRQAAVLNSVDHLVGGPPGIHRDGDRADGCDPHVGERPFRIVPEGDAHAIPGTDPLRQQSVGALGGEVPRFLEGVAFLLVDEEVPVGVRKAFCVEIPQVFRRVDERRVVDAVDAPHGGLERLTGRC